VLSRQPLGKRGVWDRDRRDLGSHRTVVGSSSDSVSPTAYIIAGTISLLIAAFAATRSGRERLGADHPRLRRRRADASRSGRLERRRADAGEALKRGSIPVAVAVGATIGLPGAIDLVAFGYIARHGYSVIATGLLIVTFVLIKLLLIDVPMLSYAVVPERTASWVKAFSGWMHVHKIQVIAAVAGVVGVGLIAKGVTSG
jgi:Sap, sulfolipid-1-addressing protein